ncbi:hypothetical protein TIFTF001_001017 [Ficus carica]|uniref:Uncharacterized protein n=1 Tax=Ficus carica TaxID=3494 RepID=A0AA87Z6Z9_FICCA|nr:hypothetical protein TIFTF001_001017 [Ficus carica]
MVFVADRYRSKAGVSCEGRGLVQETHAGTGLLHGPRCSEHYTVRAYGLFRREQGRWSAKDPVPGESPALNAAEYCRRQYFVVGEYVDINSLLTQIV